MLQMQDLMSKSMRDFKEGSIVKGRILEIRPREVLVDIGYKSEGIIPASEFDDIESLEVGDEVEVLLERLENDEGMVVLSKEKAAYRQNWNKIAQVFAGDGLIKGKVKSVVKGGLMVNIGVEAFLPASQIDIIPPRDLQQFVGNTYDFKIVKINDDRKNVVLSRRELIEQELIVFSTLRVDRERLITQLLKLLTHLHDEHILLRLFETLHNLGAKSCPVDEHKPA